MKYTVATIAAFTSMALAQPAFTNTAFDVTQGQPFTITYTGCDSGCTIILQNGESDDLNDYRTLTATADGDSFTFTPSGLPTDTYNFKIVDNESGEINYSAQFDYEGTGVATTEASTTAAASTTAESTTAESTTVLTTETSEVLTTLTSVKTSALSTLTKTSELTTIATPDVTRNATTPIASKTSSAKPTGTSTDDSSETEPAASTVPESSAARLTSSLALVAGAVMAMVYL